MARILKITRTWNLVGMAAKWKILLDKQLIGEIANDATFTTQISEGSHVLFLGVQNPITKKPTLFSEDIKIEAGSADCEVKASFKKGNLSHDNIVAQVSYSSQNINVWDFMQNVIHKMNAMLEGDEFINKYVYHKNNRRHDIRIKCVKEGVALEWAAAESGLLNGGFQTHVLRYTEMTTLPACGVTSEMISYMENEINKGILATGRYVKNQYGAYEVKK